MPTNAAEFNAIENHVNASPQYGKRLIPQIVDELANTDPTRIYASFPRSTNVSDGFRDVTFRELAQAADAASWWLERKIGRSDSSETLAYMGLSDIRYTVVFLAAVKCGFKVSLHISLSQAVQAAKVCYLLWYCVGAMLDQDR